MATIVFRLSEDNQFENSVIELLKTYPLTSNETCKRLVCAYVKQGLHHPGINPYAAQDHQQSVQPGVTTQNQISMPEQPQEFNEFNIDQGVL